MADRFMVLEEVMFGAVALPGEAIRIAIAMLGLLATTYYDLYNNRNVPNKLLYAFLALSLLVNAIFLNAEVLPFTLLIAILLGAFGFLFYKAGQLGGADVFVIVSLSLLLPLHPSYLGMQFNYPFVFSVLIFSGVAFALFSLFFFSSKLMKRKAKPEMLYLLLFLPYAVFLYLYINSPVFSPLYFAIFSILVFSTIFFLSYRKEMMKILSEKISPTKLTEEDVLALELMPKPLIEKYKLERIVTSRQIARLKKLKLKELYVYTKLPPFLPFLLLGFILALLFAKDLILLSTTQG